MVYNVYILYSASSNKYYVGSAQDWKSRLYSHNHSERVTYTSKHRPWLMVAVFSVGKTRAEAIRIENFIKKQKSRKLLEKLIDSDFVPTGNLVQLVRVPHLRD